MRFLCNVPFGEYLAFQSPSILCLYFDGEFTEFAIYIFIHRNVSYYVDSLTPTFFRALNAHKVNLLFNAVLVNCEIRPSEVRSLLAVLTWNSDADDSHTSIIADNRRGVL